MRHAFVLAAALAPACASSPDVSVHDLRGRRIVPIDRPTLATEHAAGRRTIRVAVEGKTGADARFTLAIELPDEPIEPPAERLVTIPGEDAVAFLVVAGGAALPYSSRRARGTVRLRELEDRLVAVVDLDFEGAPADRARLPAHLFRDPGGRLRVAGSFAVER